LGCESRLHRDAENAIQFIRLPVSQNCRYDGGFFSQTNNLIINTNNCPLKVHLREFMAAKTKAYSAGQPRNPRNPHCDRNVAVDY
jgi:hypothetical protein